MERKNCPYLGLPDDEKTALSFPSEGNFCHRARPAGAVKLEHQHGYCLTASHTACPVYRATTAGPLPTALAAPVPRWQPLLAPLRAEPAPAWLSRKSLLAAVALVLLVAGVVFIGAQAARRANTSRGASVSPAQQIAAGPLLLGGSLPSTGRAALDSTPLPAAQVTRDCPLPRGWQTYTVQPTDSLFRISTIYGVSVKMLQSVNCLGNETFLAPGTTLFVPAPVPTALPTATVTLAAPVVPVLPVVDPANTDDGDQDSDADEEEPTRPPVQEEPTQPPVTAEPTQTPVVEPTQAPVEEEPTLPPVIEPTQPPDDNDDEPGGGNDDDRGGGNDGDDDDDRGGRDDDDDDNDDDDRGGRDGDDDDDDRGDGSDRGGIINIILDIFGDSPSTE